MLSSRVEATPCPSEDQAAANAASAYAPLFPEFSGACPVQAENSKLLTVLSRRHRLSELYCLAGSVLLLLFIFIVVSYVGNVQASDVVPADEVCLHSLSSCWSLPISASLVS